MSLGFEIELAAVPVRLVPANQKKYYGWWFAETLAGTTVKDDSYYIGSSDTYKTRLLRWELKKDLKIDLTLDKGSFKSGSVLELKTLEPYEWHKNKGQCNFPILEIITSPVNVHDPAACKLIVDSVKKLLEALTKGIGDKTRKKITVDGLAKALCSNIKYIDETTRGSKSFWKGKPVAAVNCDYNTPAKNYKDLIIGSHKTGGKGGILRSTAAHLQATFAIDLHRVHVFLKALRENSVLFCKDFPEQELIKEALDKVLDDIKNDNRYKQHEISSAAGAMLLLELYRQCMEKAGVKMYASVWKNVVPFLLKGDWTDLYNLCFDRKDRLEAMELYYKKVVGSPKYKKKVPKNYYESILCTYNIKDKKYKADYKQPTYDLIFKAVLLGSKYDKRAGSKSKGRYCFRLDHAYEPLHVEVVGKTLRTRAKAGDVAVFDRQVYMQKAEGKKEMLPWKFGDDPTGKKMVRGKREVKMDEEKLKLGFRYGRLGPIGELRHMEHPSLFGYAGVIKAINTTIAEIKKVNAEPPPIPTAKKPKKKVEAPKKKVKKVIPKKPPPIPEKNYKKK